MKLICTASKVSWFTVGREYEVDENMRVTDDSGGAFGVWSWVVETHNGGYRTERLEDAEFSIAPGYEPVTAADDVLYSEEELQEEHEALLASVVQMADEEGCRDSFDRHLETIRHRFGLLKNPQSQRAFLLALAYFAEEKSQ
jgi:hypothetical protein